MYDFIKIQWIMRKYSETNIANCVTKKYITQAQADVILAMPQASV
ncbi:hypothetical protein [Clostridium saccharobutylicum]|uniref:XkdX family protein n=1 Tax=Clostridium saccharobutylicum DSM 13864 TaxID=1345695 RepID=U5MWE8_CLOSA|nr:hypothetical protein [Clostridium saccharobutylicum]AGX43941.1 hypothetical protein CLSA_c29740 [Clostridium saccharobutylicum DSM 13864]AQR91239.1 hypothetical protein CLOSC_29630 [Clostridium saccharobutylicum]AQS01143.1 hypothetical protein CSACC_29700 [Clostridium saccharobutylicum]AQS15126.1 hypothetical protein CLOSACC_29700 [Clostridium saccharobutylicum]MBA2905252.1 hypothetical protein [Clostridium saccharobutylicum]